ncbi:MAG TPA: saccharopine dehydrogenase C-terminal domain-containing protein [Terriglobia bacterium]|nr:saccharopine dehydrogenase C-terminal domain-containing protein [Terriglobia bacterium]
MKFVVFGAGRQGAAIVHDLTEAGHATLVVDRDSRALEAFRKRFAGRNVSSAEAELNDTPRIAHLLEGAGAAISAVPYFFNLQLAQAAIHAGVHFCDLGGNTGIVMNELRLDAHARARGVAIVPDCGLSPGMTNILAARALERVRSPHTLEIRVGGLPLHPAPPLNYQLVFSIHGLLNEYLEPAEIVEHGAPRRVPPLTGEETIAFDGFPEMEAFYTHGGVSTLPGSYANLVRNINEKTVRYKGHAAAMRTMTADSRFPDRAALGAHLESILPVSGPDVVLARVRALGRDEQDRAVVEVIDRADEVTGLSAMARTTGFSAAIVAMLAAGGKIPPGAHAQELAVDPAAVIEELRRRGIQVSER